MEAEKHVFLCYAREDGAAVDLLQAALEAAGIRVWRDATRLWPGEDWREKIRQAITGEALAFVACFSTNGLSRDRSYQNEELALAVDELRRRRPDRPWLIPVRLDDCQIPDLAVGSGRVLGHLQRADLFGERREQETARFVAGVARILGHRAEDGPVMAGGSLDDRPGTARGDRPGRQHPRLKSSRSRKGAGVSRSACWSYVTWYHGLTGNWATWEPGDVVEPGAVGFFDGQRRFTHYRTLASYGVVPVIAAAELPGRTRLVWSDGDVRLDFKPSGRASTGFEVLGDLDAGLKVTANRAHACILHMRDLRETWIEDADTVLRHLKGLLLNGNWDVDSVVVARCVEARRGFAAVSAGAGQSFEVKADGGAHLADIADLGHAEFVLAPERNRGDFLFYNFGPGSTPVFTSAIRVRRDLWDRLLPWRQDGGVLIGPDGRRYRELPENLADQELEARRYDPARSAMPPGELSGLAVEDLFEEVADLRDEGPAWQPATRHIPGRVGGQVLSLRLPAVPGPAALAATDPVEGGPPVVEVTSPDGLARLALFDRGEGEYWLEVSVSGDTRLPLLVRVRYTTGGQRPREILVPVGDSATSVVSLRGYDGRPWRAWVSVPPASMWSGPPDLVKESVGAALTTATMRAWERLAADGSGYGQRLVADAIAAFGEEP